MDWKTIKINKIAVYIEFEKVMSFIEIDLLLHRRILYYITRYLFLVSTNNMFQRNLH